jgi:WD40 repeat protein
MKRAILVGATCLLLAGFLAPIAIGQGAAGGSFVGSDTVWKTGEVLQTSAEVEQVRFSANGRLAVLASSQGVSVWDWKKDKETHYFAIPKGSKLRCLALSADGKRLATGHLDNTRVLVWDLSEGVVLAELNHGAPVHALAFSVDGKQLASGGGHSPDEKADADSYVQLWNIADKKVVRRFAGPKQPVRTLAITADSIVADDARGAAFVWSRLAGGLKAQFETHAFVTPLGIIAKEGTLVGYEVGAGRFLTRWDFAGKKERLIDMSPESQPIKHGFWSNSDGSLAATSHPGELNVWDLKTKERRCTLPIPPRENQVLALTFTPDSSELVVALGNKTVVRLPVEKGR